VVFAAPELVVPEGVQVRDQFEVTADLASQCLYNEPEALRLKELPTVKK